MEAGNRAIGPIRLKFGAHPETCQLNVCKKKVFEILHIFEIIWHPASHLLITSVQKTDPRPLMFHSSSNASVDFFEMQTETLLETQTVLCSVKVETHSFPTVPVSLANSK